ncbi:hypothetical protein [Streptomyces purpureus]|uniref:Uncharacterized protein n=1 Tax=Streptomyces purpureus TaxID=1951 RepID=A0A918LPA0_9ACTN|nr:hypothetical protein [Streptomyces purpureus]GGT31185.1 hypothetical protein GCM10014713_25780 [Streptomyces purpureus]
MLLTPTRLVRPSRAACARDGRRPVEGREHMPVVDSDRVTVFHMFGELFAYSTRSEGDIACGEVGIVGVLDHDSSPGILWTLATQYCRERDQAEQHAQWITSQASRARVSGGGRLADLRDARWEFQKHKEHRFGALYFNHELLRTGHMRVVGLDLALLKAQAEAGRRY